MTDDDESVLERRLYDSSDRNLASEQAYFESKSRENFREAVAGLIIWLALYSIIFGNPGSHSWANTFAVFTNIHQVGNDGIWGLIKLSFYVQAPIAVITRTIMTSVPFFVSAVGYALYWIGPDSWVRFERTFHLVSETAIRIVT